MSRSLQFIGNQIQSRSGFGFGLTSKGPVTPTHIKNFISNVQFERIAHDIGMWRDAIREMELAWHPSRVRAQRLFMDSVENPYIKSVIERWEDLTLQRKMVIYQSKGDKKIVSDDLTDTIKEQYWFLDYLQYALQADAYGYSLIQLGDCIDDSFPEIEIVQRENIVPDGAGRGKPIVTNMTYGMNGLDILGDEMMNLSNHWMPTKSTRGVSSCGYGWLYNIALLEIHLRNITEWNADFVESYAQPIKVGSTNKKGPARQAFEEFLASGSSNQWMLLDKAMGDEVKYEMAAQAGTAWKSYDNLEERLKGTVAQLILGHTDAMRSQPGKLGGQQAANKDGFNESLIEQAMNSKKVRAGINLERRINEIAAPRFRVLGKKIGSKIIANLLPKGYRWGLLNDTEENEISRRLNSKRLIVSEWVKNLNDGGYNVTVKDIEDATGLTGLTVAPPEHTLHEDRTTETTIKRVDPGQSDGGKTKTNTQSSTNE